MDQNEIITILNKYVFAAEKAYLIQNITKNPERFLGVFRSTTPGLKIIQNLLQSREIRFGDALEVIVRRLIESEGFENLARDINLVDGTTMKLDQYFKHPTSDIHYLVEQKVRDDHDSAKKVGQLQNFRSKLAYLKEKHGAALVGIMYFIDPSLHKNRRYYTINLQVISDELNIPLYLNYNGEFFINLTGNLTTWELLENSLLAWQSNVTTTVNINCDTDDSLKELITVSPSVWYKLTSNEELWSKGVIRSIFPQGVNLKEVSLHFAQTGSYTFAIGRRAITYITLATLIKEKVVRYYGIQYDLPINSQDRLL